MCFPKVGTPQPVYQPEPKKIDNNKNQQPSVENKAINKEPQPDTDGKTKQLEKLKENLGKNTDMNPIDTKVNFGGGKKGEALNKNAKDSHAGGEAKVKPEGSAISAVAKGIAAGVAAAVKNKGSESENVKELMKVMLDSSKKPPLMNEIADIVKGYDKNPDATVSKLQDLLKKNGVKLDSEELHGMCITLNDKVDGKSLMQNILDMPKPSKEQNGKVQTNIQNTKIDLTDFFTSGDAKNIKQQIENVLAGKGGC